MDSGASAVDLSQYWGDGADLTEQIEGAMILWHYEPSLEREQEGPWGHSVRVLVKP